jgi:MoaA/NifB/PqqE/SkfB family radical SAM enzyme
MPVPCNVCVNNEHCWGCRASAYHYHRDANGVDPKCWLVAEYLEQHPTEA